MIVFKIIELTCQQSGWRAVASDWIASSFLNIFSALTPRAQNNPHFSQNKETYSGANIAVIPITRPHGKPKEGGNVPRCVFQCIFALLLGWDAAGRFSHLRSDSSGTTRARCSMGNVVLLHDPCAERFFMVKTTGMLWGGCPLVCTAVQFTGSINKAYRQSYTLCNAWIQKGLSYN